MDKITEKIKRLREDKGILKAKMSAALDIDPSNYNRYEKNGKDWSLTQIQKISEVLGVSVVELLTGESRKVEDSEEVERLIDRIKELEDRIKDKDFMIDRLGEEYVHTVYDVKHIITIALDIYILKNGYCHIEVISGTNQFVKSGKMDERSAWEYYNEQDLFTRKKIAVTQNDLEEACKNFVNSSPELTTIFKYLLKERIVISPLLAKYLFNPNRVRQINNPFDDFEEEAETQGIYKILKNSKMVKCSFDIID